MDAHIPEHAKNTIANGIRDKYSQVAENPEGWFHYPTGRAGLEALGYDPALLQRLPERVAAGYCGVGNPFSLGPIDQGQTVLDIGCGAGVDTLLAAMLVGPAGNATGVDIVPEILQRAETNQELAGISNATFSHICDERLPYADNSFDAVISNGVFNLILDKAAALSEARRVLRPGGRIMIADQILAGPLEKDLPSRVASWFQ